MSSIFFVNISSKCSIVLYILSIVERLIHYVTDKNLKTCTFLKIQVVYKLLVLKQKDENIIQYFIFTSNQKSACLEVSNCK